MLKRISGLARHFTAGVFILYCALSMIGFWRAGEQALIDRLEDDAYYYFVVAENLTQGKGLTFDGTTLTNGFHPLWLLALLPVFALCQDPLLCLRIVGALSVLLAGCAGFFAFRHLYRYRGLAFLIPGVFFVVAMISIGNTGMETALLLFLLLAALLVAQAPSTGLQPAITGGLLALALLARLDAIFLVAILCAMSLGNVRRDFWMGAIPAGTLGIYLLVNLSQTGHLLPTSGAAKSMLAPGAWYNARFWEQLTTPNNPVDGNVWVVFSLATLVSLGLVVILIFQALRSRSLLEIRRYRMQFALASFIVVYTLYYLLSSSWVLWRWYAYPLIPFSIFVLPSLIEAILRRFEAYPQLSRGLKLGLGLVTLLMLLDVTLLGLRFGNWASNAQPSFKYANSLAAWALNERFDEATIVAMGDRAGSFAYFFEGDVLQLEGLLGDHALLQAIRGDSLMAYMHDFGVDYVATYTPPPAHYDHWELHTPLPELTAGPVATIALCRQAEYMRIESPYQTLYLWRWPACGED